MSLTLPEYKIKSTLRKSLVKMTKKGVDTSKIYRVFLSGVYQPEFLGNHNAETFSSQEHIALNAFRGTSNLLISFLLTFPLLFEFKHRFYRNSRRLYGPRTKNY